ncbi:hypothetical protein C8R45DRAFT_1185225, partial [Mycena sanguinolenta]
ACSRNWSKAASHDSLHRNTIYVAPLHCRLPLPALGIGQVSDNLSLALLCATMRPQTCKTLLSSSIHATALCVLYASTIFTSAHHSHPLHVRLLSAAPLSPQVRTMPARHRHAISRSRRSRASPTTNTTPAPGQLRVNRDLTLPRLVASRRLGLLAPTWRAYMLR